MPLSSEINREPAGKAEMWFALCQHQYHKAEDGRLFGLWSNCIITVPRREPKKTRNQTRNHNLGTRSREETWKRSKTSIKTRSFPHCRAEAFVTPVEQIFILPMETWYSCFLIFSLLNGSFYGSHLDIFLLLYQRIRWLVKTTNSLIQKWRELHLTWEPELWASCCDYI